MKKQILVVENERIVAEDIKKTLNNLGYDVSGIASSGEEAVKKAKETHPDLALMDIVLEGNMDGIDAANQIYSSFGIPVVYLTAYADEEKLQRVKISEPFGYILKPFEERELHTTIETALYKHKMEKALRASEERYRTIIDNIEDGYFEIDLVGNLIFFNDSICEMSGYSRDEITGINNREYTTPETSKKMYHIFNQIYRTGKPEKVTDYEIIKKDGTILVLELSTSLMQDSSGQPIGFRGVARDITDRKLAEDKLAYMATHDPLTGLPNRVLFNDRFTLALAHAQRDQKKMAVMLLDLDRFKDVNDSLGHKVGDLLLQNVSERLTGLLRKGDTIARMGGDEFLFLLPEIVWAEDAATVALKVLETFREPFLLEANELNITTSVGVAMYPDDGEDIDELLKNVDIAMYHAKEKGRNNFQWYNSAMNAKARK